MALVAPIATQFTRITSGGFVKNSQPPLVRFEDIPGHMESRAAQAVDQGTSLQRFVEGAPTGKLMVAEEVETGHVEKLACKLTFATCGCVDSLRVTVRLYVLSLSRYPIAFWMTVIGAILLNETSIALQSWFLGVWATQYENHPASEVAVS